MVSCSRRARVRCQRSRGAGLRFVAQGADIIDVVGIHPARRRRRGRRYRGSTVSRSSPLYVAIERAHSVDTYKAQYASRRAVGRADLVNDVWHWRLTPAMALW
jgi:dihydropteroate synthase